MAKTAQKLDRITATIALREINSQNDGAHPKLTPDDARNIYRTGISKDGGLEVYALCKGEYTLLMRAVKTDRPAKSLLDYKWIKW